MKISKVSLILLGVFGVSISAQAMPCGKVPVYCIVESKLDGGSSAVYSYAVQPDKIDCAPTSFQLGNASPICQLISRDMSPYFRMCVSKYNKENQRVVGVSFFKGGDPTHPADSFDVSMFGQFYKTHQLYADDLHGSTPNLSPRAGCDIVTD